MYDNNEMYARCELIARLDLKLTRALAIFALFMLGDVHFIFPDNGLIVPANGLVFPANVHYFSG